MTEAIISIEGMSCQHCVMRVKKAIEGLKGINKADVQIGQAKVKFDESLTGKKEIEEAIVKAGYKVKG
ncbi:MAG TPA: heavy-metal-associated domain-containing protein [Candidatus Sulfobium mesophilum]|jgi:copper ion binding protein|uniref:Mercury ion binding protein n=1 Tax=Candidatus Sulfobium mesophilum TaxID=2016548 RepID=A0A2U3QJA6_9BACT|nr:Mercury ion binding protein [Candidatus Sulfobium mesophilum]HSB31128.1 heavy-metal-associated domain-containing protein [Candidatus Sulfobium mesophilum]